MKPELKHHYQTKVYNYYTANEAAYKAILELGDTPNPDAYKKIAKEHNVNVGDVLNIYHLIRQLKTIGIPVNPPQPVDKSKKVYESSNGTKAIYRNQTNTGPGLILRYKTYLHNYYTANETVYKAILQLGDIYNPDAYKKIAEERNVNIGGVRIAHYVMRHLKSMGVPVDPPEPVDKPKKVPESSRETEAMSRNQTNMNPELNFRYHRDVYSFYNNHEAAYKALLELSDTPNLAACKKIAEDHNLQFGHVENIHYMIRKLKRMGVPVDPSQPVNKPKKVPESSKGTKAMSRNQTTTFFATNEAAYKAILELGDTPNQDAYKKIAEKHNLKFGHVENIHYVIRKMKNIGVSVDPPQPVKKVNKVQKLEQECRIVLEGFKRNHAECYNGLKGIVASDQPLERSDATRLGEKYGLTPEMITNMHYLMKRYEQQEEQEKEDGEDPDPNQPSTSGPTTRMRYEDPAYSGDYQLEESSGQWSKQGIRRVESSGGRSREGNDAIEYFREPSSSSSRKRTDRQGEGDDWLNLDPRTRSAGGTSERKSRQAKKISVPRAISTKRQHPSGSPNAPEAKRRQMDEKEQLEPRGLCEPATSPSPPPEHRNPRGDTESVMVSRQMEEVEVTKSSRNAQEKFNEIKTHFKAIRSSLSQMTSDDIEEMRTDLEWELSTIQKTLEQGNGNNSLGSGKAKTIEPERDRRRTTGPQTDSPVILEPAEDVEPDEDVRGAEVPKEQQSNPEMQETTRAVSESEEKVGEQRMDLETQPIEDHSAQRGVESNPNDSLAFPRHRASPSSVKRQCPIGSLDAPTAKQKQPEREDMDSTGQTRSRVLSEPAEHGIPQDDRGASQMEGADNTHKWFESTYRDINVTLEILYNSFSQLKDEDVIEVGRSLRIDLKEMKRLLQSSAISKKIPRKRQFVELSEIINDIKTHLIKLESFLNEVTAEDRDGMSDVLRLDLNKVRMMLYYWNGNEDEAIKEEEIDEEEGVKTENPDEVMEQEQQDGTPEDQPEPQVKQEPEEEPVADPNF